MAMSEQDVFNKVRDVLVEALVVDEDQVTPEARLVGDLGAESIDFLDINFRLEKAFNIKIEQGELFPENVLQDPRYVSGGTVTPEGLAELKKRLPNVDLTQFEKNPKVDEFANIFTVKDFVAFVQSKVK